MTNKQGFTLIELLVVVSIMSVLSSILMVSISQSRMKARDALRISQIHEMRKAVEIYFANHNRYPDINNFDMPGGWSDLIQYLRTENILGMSTSLRTSTPVVDGFLSLFQVRDVYAFALPTNCPQNVAPQDPQFECKVGGAPIEPGVALEHTFAYMSSMAQGWQTFRLRTRLENLGNPILNSGLTGNFLFAGDNGCDRAQGYYCIGQGSYVPDF